MTQVGNTMTNVISRGFKFYIKQDRDWRITAIRSNLAMFLYKTVLPYVSIYVMALGATGTQLGIVNSIGMIVAGIFGPLGGWLIDRIGIKKVYLFGIVILAGAYLVYGLAQSWPIIIVAMMAFWLGQNTSILGCSVICANCMQSTERATGMAICETFGMGLLGLAAPMVGAWLVTAFGGMNVEGIRPLFYVCLAGTVATFFLVVYQISSRKWGNDIQGINSNPIKDFIRVFEEGRDKKLKRWLIFVALTGMEMGVATPYIQPFAYEVKGADQFVLGAMVTANAIVPLVLGIPFGRLADKIGRKKVLYFSIPIVWASYLLLLMAPNSGFLIASGACLGFLMINGITTTAMSRELVPPEQMGMWSGTMQLARMVFSAILIYLSGVIWDNLSPNYVFITLIGLNVIRIPLLIGMPETLGTQYNSEPEEQTSE
jgi:MFS family permease